MIRILKECLKNSTVYSWGEYRPSSANEIRFHCTAKSPKITIKPLKPPFFRSEFLKNSIAYCWSDYRPTFANEIRFHAKSLKIKVKISEKMSGKLKNWLVFHFQLLDLLLLQYVEKLILTNMGHVCKILKKDCRLFATHCFLSNKSYWKCIR